VLAAIDTFTPTKTRFESNLRPYSIQLGTERNDVQGLRGLSQVVERLETIESHAKSIVFIGEGVESHLDERPLYEGASGDPWSSLINGLAESVARSNIRLYTLDPRGPAGMFADGYICGVEFLPWADRARVAKESLGYMAQQTGGTSVLNATDFTAAADRLVADMSTYYSIGYYPTNTKADGKYRRVRIETTKRGLDVRSYNGYWAPRPEKKSVARATAAPADPAAAALDRAILGLVPVSDLVLRASAPAFAPAARRRTSLMIPLRVESPHRDDRLSGTEPAGSLRLRILIVDMKGKVHSTEVRSAQLGPVPIVVDVPPGRYVVRLAAWSPHLNAAGSLFLDIDVPGFAASARKK
jgi:hypothetical protein